MWTYYISLKTISHYVLIKNFSRLISSQINKHEHEIFFCNRCLQPCSSEEVLSKRFPKYTSRTQNGGTRKPAEKGPVVGDEKKAVRE